MKLKTRSRREAAALFNPIDTNWKKMKLYIKVTIRATGVSSMTDSQIYHTRYLSTEGESNTGNYGGSHVFRAELTHTSSLISNSRLNAQLKATGSGQQPHSLMASLPILGSLGGFPMLCSLHWFLAFFFSPLQLWEQI